MVINESNPKRLVHLLRGKLSSGFFDGDLLVLDLSAIAGSVMDLRDIVACLVELNVRPVAVSGASGGQSGGIEAGLAVLPDHAVARSEAAATEPAALVSEEQGAAARTGPS